MNRHDHRATEKEPYYSTPFGMIDACRTVSPQDLIAGHVLVLYTISGDLSELADEAPPELAEKMRKLAAVISGSTDDLSELEESLADDMDDAALIRVYARENATQRGNNSTAQAGTIASAIRFLSKAVMTGGLSPDFRRNHDIEKPTGKPCER